MKSINLLKFILVFAVLSFSSCEKGTVVNKNTNSSGSNSSANKIQESEVSKIKPNVLKGNYFIENETGIFKECDSPKKYIIAPEGDNIEIEKAFRTNSGKTSSTKIYAEVEGFISERSSKKGSGMDTILIITKFIKSDSNLSCE